MNTATLRETVPSLFATKPAAHVSEDYTFVPTWDYVQKFMDKLADEQEILMAAADIAIQIFAVESAVLRAEKIFGDSSEKKQELLKAAVKVCAFSATEIVSTAAKKGAFYVEEGDTLTMILSGVRRFTKYDASGLLQAKRTLANAALETEKYLF